MDMEKVVLTGAQFLGLQDIDDESNHGEGWCDVSEMQKVVLKELESSNYIVFNAVQESARITTKGVLALGNHVLRGSAEHGQMLLQKTEVQRVPTKPFESIMRKPNGDIPQRPQVETAPIMPKRQPMSCIVENCGKPRMVTTNGKRLTRCVAHQREYWNEQWAKKRHPDAKPVERRKKPINVEVTTAAVVEQIAAAKQRTCADECRDCTYREVVGMLRAKYPQINELVEAVERVKAIRDGLGI